jgi:hypothetical protein
MTNNNNNDLKNIISNGKKYETAYQQCLKINGKMSNETTLESPSNSN